MKINGLKVHVTHSDVDVNSSSSVMKQVNAISEALTEIGAKPYVSNFSNAMKKLSGHKDRPDMVFNLVREVKGSAKDMYRAAMFFQNSYYLYTGSAYKSLQSLSDRVLAKRMMAEKDVLTPIWHKYGEPDSFFHKGEYLVKELYKNWLIAADGTAPVSIKDADDADTRISATHPEKPEDFFAERYIEGREIKVSMLEVGGKPVVMPTVEMVKENGETVQQTGTVSAGSRLEEKLEKIALSCWEIFHMTGYSEIGFIVDKLSEPYVFSVDAAPELLKGSSFISACEKGGYSFNQVIENILKSAMRGK